MRETQNNSSFQFPFPSVFLNSNFSLKHFITKYIFQPEWARPPSTASSDGYVPPATTPTTTTMRPLTTTTRTTTASRPTEASQAMETLDEVPVVLGNEPVEVDEDADNVDCTNKILVPHARCDKVRRSTGQFT